MNAAPPERRALGPTEIVTQLSKLNGERAQGWKLIDDALEKSFDFADYYQTMAFVNALAFIAHTEDHHPELAVGYGRCTVRLRTHDVDGISTSDFFCASRIDALLA
jgi:4a-hydroxytetrahydrobiopterin dehydratase